MKAAIPSAAENTPENADTTPCKDGKEISAVSVKFNKEIRRIPIEEASVLAQKGLKYDLISEDFSRLKNMALKKGQSVTEFLNGMEEEAINNRRAELMEQTGGNGELAEHIISLENMTSSSNREFDELRERFPEIKEIGELPQQVLETSKALGKNLLDTYLRYLLDEKIKQQNAKKQQAAVNLRSTGTLSGEGSACGGTADREFIKGLWGN